MVPPVLLRFLIPVALAAVVIVAAATAGHKPGSNRSVRPIACVHSDRVLASVGCRP
jgi:hypothetical protein